MAKDYDIATKSVQDEILDAVTRLETNLSGTLTVNVVKSVQRGVVPWGTVTTYTTEPQVAGFVRSFYTDVKISEVDVNKSTISVSGYADNRIAQLINSTTLRVFRNSSTESSSKMDCSGFSYEVIEFY